MDVNGPALLGLLVLAAWAAIDTAAFGQFMIGQPVAAGWLAGVLVGRPLEGLFMGTALQMLWSRLAPVGAAAYPDVGPATVGGVGTLLFWPSAGAAGDAGAAGLPARLGFVALPDGWRLDVPPVGLLIGLGLALLAGAAGQRLVVAMRRHNADLGHAADRAAAAGSFGGVERANLLGLARAAALGVAVTAGTLLAGAALAFAAARLPLAAATLPNPGPILFWWMALAALGTALWSGGRRDGLWLLAGVTVGTACLFLR
jgi:PTS system mannose-specific IIC component